jgi:hypothetical protein
MESGTHGQPAVQDGETDDASVSVTLPSPRDDGKGDGSETVPLAENSNIILGED